MIHSTSSSSFLFHCSGIPTQFDHLLTLYRANLENIPIDRIEMSSRKYDFVVEDIVFHGQDLLPDHLLLKIRNVVDLNLKDAQTDQTTHKLKLVV